MASKDTVIVSRTNVSSDAKTRRAPRTLPRIFWAGRQKRLFDLLDQNEQYRGIFAEQKSRKHSGLSKTQCYLMLAEALLADDEDDDIRRAFPSNREHYANALRMQIFQLREKYRSVNERLGPVFANMPYEQFVVGTRAYSNLKKILGRDQLWKRMHQHWRTIPEFNQLYKPREGEAQQEESIKQEKRQTNTTVKMEAKRTEIIDLESLSDIGDPSATRDDLSYTPEPSPEIGQSNRLTRSRKRKSPSIEDTSDSVPPGDMATSVSTSGGSDSNRKREIKLEIAQIALKRQKLENDALERNAETRRLELEAEERRRNAEAERAREREQHERFMSLMAMARPSMGGDNSSANI